MPRHAWNLPEIVRETRKWLEDPQQIQMQYDDSIDFIERAVRALSDEDHGGLSVCMETLGHWYYNLAVVAIVDGKSTGWSTMRRGLHWTYWGIRYGMESRIRKNPDRKTRSRGGILLCVLAHCFSHGCGTRDDDISGWCGEFIVRTLDEGIATLWQSPYEVFVVHLYLKWRRLDMDLTPYDPPSLGVYEEVLDSWQDNQRLQASLLEACNYHCERIYSPTDEEESPEFIWEPYIVFPAEILAIQRVRHDMGLTTPVIEHPLMQSPLADPPREPPDFEDELLAQVLERIR